MKLIEINPESQTIAIIDAPSVADAMPGVLLEHVPLSNTDTLWIDEEGLLAPFKPFLFNGQLFAGRAVIETSEAPIAFMCAVILTEFPTLESAQRIYARKYQADADYIKAMGATGVAIINASPAGLRIVGDRLVAS